jgi:hypothetical protein
MNYKVESDFTYYGYRCVVIFSYLGFRCGYVGIPKKHPLYGIEYNQETPKLKKENMEDKEIGKRSLFSLMFMNPKSNYISPEVYFDIHGSLTYSGKDKNYPVESDLWWFGFDCGHLSTGDDADYDLIYPYFNDNPKLLKSLSEYLEDAPNLKEMFGFNEDEMTIRDKEYVEEECRSLAEQLYELSIKN